MPEELKAKLIEDLAEGDGGAIFSGVGGRIFFNKKNGKVKAKRLVSYHKSFEGNDVLFEINQESAGTLRIIDLLPKFHELQNHKAPQVFVIDELD